MEVFDTLDAVAAPLDRPNVDTEQIMPSRFLRRSREDGFQDFVFRDLRFTADGTENPDFVLNHAAFRHARILVADRNFGGGSSREAAPWGLLDYGMRCVIAADFGEIFYLNSLKVGLLPVQLDAAVCEHLRAQLHGEPGSRLRVDLPAQTVTAPDGTVHAFQIDPFRKRGLLLGLDDVGLTLQYQEQLAVFEQQYRARFDWLFQAARPDTDPPLTPKD
ncbi:3-isopropylmalate dehydratase small subunit [Xylophilus sp. GOD-11R]|uniref:3-isopropylmalate dehydratase small subunit n=1 Tax=Xylophilus sp. GOD-11R TaxID=3089814 RepID=UPI00298CF9C3|nr:3-isopropylmalate dehydratase small subunit [Xylophilus sp. GOD-11R]WPB55868.1 3-isopropylmalate dehydratase small subunit [Xylophilus sp. GOD-11R]